MDQANSLTSSLAIAFGIYMLAAGAAGVLDRQRWHAVLADLKAQPGLVYISGVFVFALGVALVLVHNDWSNWLAGLVSLIGWGAAIEGIVLILAPAPLLGFAEKLMLPHILSAFIALALTLGALLLLGGLSGAGIGGAAA